VADPQQGSAHQPGHIIPGPASAAPTASPPVIGQVVELSAAQAGATRQAIASQLAHAAPQPPMTNSDESPRATSSRAPMATMPGGLHDNGATLSPAKKAANTDARHDAKDHDGPLGTGSIPTRRFNWRHLLLILAAAFLLGITIAWGAIAIGAEIVDFWPHGFGLYAMLIGGGVTMMLTAGLMTAVFYSDSSGHDAEVHQFQPEKPRRNNLRQ